MNKKIIKLDENNNILAVLDTFDYVEDDIELSEEEYKQSYRFKKFNPTTREFSEVISSSIESNEVELLIKETYQTTQVVSDDNLINMELICALDEKITLIMAHLGLNG